MKNKKGFTLIELLVVIALMLSILGIAVVSLMNASNKKKKESWEQVKGQIETAAEEYVNTNSYMFDGLGDDVTGKISVGTLVNEDFLNKITNPKTFQSGWFVNGSQKDIYPVTDSVESVCAKACESKY